MVGDGDIGTLSDAPRRNADECGIAASEYPKLLERVPAIIYVADTGGDGRWHYVSPRIEQILGYRAAEWCANPGLWAERLHPEDRGWVLARENGLNGVKPDDAWKSLGKDIWFDAKGKYSAHELAVMLSMIFLDGARARVA